MIYSQSFEKDLHTGACLLLHLEPWDHVDEPKLIYWTGYMEKNPGNLANNLPTTKHMRGIILDHTTH